MTIFPYYTNLMLNLVQIHNTYMFDNKDNTVLSFWVIFICNWYNITNRQNIWQKYYNASRNKEEYIYQYGLFPVGGCRVYF